MEASRRVWRKEPNKRGVETVIEIIKRKDWGYGAELFPLCVEIQKAPIRTNNKQQWGLDTTLNVKEILDFIKEEKLLDKE